MSQLAPRFVSGRPTDLRWDEAIVLSAPGCSHRRRSRASSTVGDMQAMSKAISDNADPGRWSTMMASAREIAARMHSGHPACGAPARSATWRDRRCGAGSSADGAPGSSDL